MIVVLVMAITRATADLSSTGCPGDESNSVVVAEYACDQIGGVNLLNSGTDGVAGDGALTNGVTFSPDVPPIDANCGHSLSFPGIGAGKHAPAVQTAASYDPLGGATNFTIMAWVKRESLTEKKNRNARIVSDTSSTKKGSKTAGVEFFFSRKDHTLALRINGGEVTATAGNLPPNAGQWHHVAVVYEDTRQVHFYVDAVQQGPVVSNSLPNAVVFTNACPLTIGNCAVKRTSARLFAGKIDAVRVLRGFSPAAVGAGLTNTTILCYMTNSTHNIAPTVGCPSNVTVAVDAAECFASTVTLPPPVVAEGCGSVMLTNDAPTQFPVGNTVVTWRATDTAGVTLCPQTVTVIESVLPTITCPSNITVNANPGQCFASPVNLGLPQTADNCSVAGVANNAPAQFPVGDTLVTWTAKDAAGNSNACSQIVTVVDDQPPSIICPGDATLPADTGQCFASASNLTAAATTDNCAVSSLTNNAPPQLPLGLTPVTWTATDAAGNRNSCTQLVTVVASNANPCDNDGTGLLGEYFDNASATYANAANFTGLALTRLNPTVDFDWGQGAPDPSMGTNTFSIRWTGQVKPEHTETYSFFTDSNDGVKLWVNGQLIIDRWVTGAARSTGTVALVAGTRYDLRLEYFENIGNASAKLYWWSQSQTKQIIPATRLYPDTNAACSVTSPLSAVGLVGGPFNYQVTGSNLPFNFSAAGLPTGLSFDAVTGLITGTPTAAGNFKVLLSANNSHGTGYAVLDLTILDTGGTIYREYWNGVSGLTNIPINTAPSGSNTLTSLQGPTNSGDNFGARIRGWLTPQVSGNYRFWIASDGPSEFWMATDGDAVNRVRRCRVTSATAALDWAAEPNQKSYLLKLTAGQPHYIEILHAETTGTDHVEVGWAKPGEAGNAPSEIVPGYVLSPYTATAQSGLGTRYVATMTPQGAALSQGSGVATLRLAADELSADLSFNYSNLTGPVTSEHIHDAGTGGPIMFDIDEGVPTNGVYHWVFAPTGNLSVQDQINSIKSGNAYINIHTALYPSGEIKGTFQLTAGSSSFTPPAPPPALPGGNPTTNDATRFLTQATFGPTKEMISQVVTQGFSAWLDQQINAPMSSHLGAVIDYYAANPLAATNGNPVFNTWWKTGLTAPDQLRQRVAFALSEILVVSQASPDLDQEPWGLASYYDVLVTNAFGNVRQLLEDVTLHPTMGLYLDMLRNDKPDAATGRNPNENYAREILQLFSIGLQKKHPDGSLKLSSQGLPIPTYDQNSVVGYAHTFTGWAYYSTNQNFFARRDLTNQMTLVNSHHDTANEKLLLDNVVLPAGQAGAQDLQDALDVIFNHPNTGPFICRQLIQRLVTVNPSPGYLYRVTSVFNDNGAGVRGDLQAVVRAILTDYEARSTATLNNQGTGHLREPLLRTTAVLRAFYGTSVSTNYALNNTDNQLAQTPLRATTVFNFFEPDYIHPGEIALAGLFAPEFQITSETTVIQYMNFQRDGVYRNNGYKGELKLDLTYEQSLATSPTALVDHFNTLLLAGNMSGALRSYLITQVAALPGGTSAELLERGRTAVHLIITSPEFCVQR